MYSSVKKILPNINRKPLIENIEAEMIYSWMLTKLQEKPGEDCGEELIGIAISAIAHS
jgi:hypothetical protein